MLDELRTLIARHCHGPYATTILPWLVLSRSPVATEPVASIYHPLMCVVAEGRKRIFLGEEVFDYDPATYLVTSVDLPVTGQVLEGPSLGLTLALNPRLLATLLLDLPPTAGSRGVAKAMEVNALGADLLDPILRLLRLLDQPQDVPVLAPLIEREVHYRLLLGARGAMLRQLARPASELSQVSRSIHAIRNRYEQSIRISELAELAGMSAPSFHRHFRAVTAMSPLQFQKRLRLQEARRRLLSEPTGAAGVGFEVGYESASQFSREYRRLFGVSPSREAASKRRAVQAG